MFQSGKPTENEGLAVGSDPGETSDAPRPLDEAIVNRDLSVALQEVELLLVGAGSSPSTDVGN